MVERNRKHALRDGWPWGVPAGSARLINAGGVRSVSYFAPVWIQRTDRIKHSMVQRVPVASLVNPHERVLFAVRAGAVIQISVRDNRVRTFDAYSTVTVRHSTSQYVMLLG